MNNILFFVFLGSVMNLGTNADYLLYLVYRYNLSKYDIFTFFLVHISCSTTLWSFTDRNIIVLFNILLFGLLISLGIYNLFLWYTSQVDKV